MSDSCADCADSSNSGAVIATHVRTRRSVGLRLRDAGASHLALDVHARRPVARSLSLRCALSDGSRGARARTNYAPCTPQAHRSPSALVSVSRGVHECTHHRGAHLFGRRGHGLPRARPRLAACTRTSTALGPQRTAAPDAQHAQRHKSASSGSCAALPREARRASSAAQASSQQRQAGAAGHGACVGCPRAPKSAQNMPPTAPRRTARG
jgi:hypothetical protein